MRYAVDFLDYSELALFGDLLLISVAIVALIYLVRGAWRFFISVVSSMAGMLSWALAVAAIAFLFVRLARFFI